MGYTSTGAFNLGSPSLSLSQPPQSLMQQWASSTGHTGATLSPTDTQAQMKAAQAKIEAKKASATSKAEVDKLDRILDALRYGVAAYHQGKVNEGQALAIANQAQSSAGIGFARFVPYIAIGGIAIAAILLLRR